MGPQCYQSTENGTCNFGTTCKFHHGTDNETKTEGLEFEGDLKSQPSKNASRGLEKAKSQTKEKKYKQRNNMPEELPKPQDSLDELFAQYSPFNYQSTRPSWQEFYRMCDFFSWSRDDHDRNVAHRVFKDALILQFNSIYGSNLNDPESWRKLCLALKIDPLPEGLDAMRDVSSP